MLTPLHATLLIWLSLAGMTATTPPAPNSLPPRCAARTTSFVWRSGFWLNLHNFLHHAAKQRGGIHNDAPGALAIVFDDTVGVRALTTSERQKWDAATTYYLTNPLTRGFVDSIVQHVNERLADADSDDTLEDVTIDSGLREVLIRVAPIYRAVWWPVHDQRNRQWIAAERQLLEPEESCVAQRVIHDLAAPWPDSSIVIDASVYATWFGAYSTHHPTHITLSSNARGNQGTLGVETIFHETGHGMTAPVDSALRARAGHERRTLPDELAHLALFYTVGEAVRVYFPDHIPYADVFGLWNQNTTAKTYRAILVREWQPYLDGRRTLADAIAGIVRSLPAEAGVREVTSGSR